MTLLFALAVCIGTLAGLPAGRAAGRGEADLRTRAGILIAIAVILFGLHTVAVGMVGASGASGLLAAIAGGLVAYGIAFGLAGYLTRSARWVGGAVSRRGKKDVADASDPAGTAKDA